jgi:hypothetical protein
VAHLARPAGVFNYYTVTGRKGAGVPLGTFGHHDGNGESKQTSNYTYIQIMFTKVPYTPVQINFFVSL